MIQKFFARVQQKPDQLYRSMFSIIRIYCYFMKILKILQLEVEENVKVFPLSFSAEVKRTRDSLKSIIPFLFRITSIQLHLRKNQNF